MPENIIHKKGDKIGCQYCKNELMEMTVDVHETDPMLASQVKTINDKFKQPEDGMPSYCPDCGTNIISGVFDIVEISDNVFAPLINKA